MTIFFTTFSPNHINKAILIANSKVLIPNMTIDFLNFSQKNPYKAIFSKFLFFLNIKLYMLKNSEVLLWDMTIIFFFWKSCLKLPKYVYLVPNWNFFVDNEVFWFEIWQYFLQIPVQKHQNKTYSTTTWTFSYIKPGPEISKYRSNIYNI